MQYTEICNRENIDYGTAIMPFISLINHSCESNVLWIPTPKHFELYAIHPIKKGEQVLADLYCYLQCMSIYLLLCVLYITYMSYILQLLDHYCINFSVMLKSERKEKLQRQYYFNCNCVPCKENWPMYNELQSFEVNDKFDQQRIKL